MASQTIHGMFSGRSQAATFVTALTSADRPLKKGSRERCPLFVINNADGSPPFFQTVFGHVGNTIYGMRLTPDDPVHSIESIASHHIASIRRLVPTGPYALCGYSFGGIVAYEMARQLAALDREIPILIMIDASTFGMKVEWTKSELALQWARRISCQLRILGRSGIFGAPRYLVDRTRVRLRAKRATEHYNRTLEKQIAEAFPEDRQEFAHRVSSTVVRYCPKSYSGEAALLRATDHLSADSAFDPKNGWGKLIGRLTIQTTPGNHLNLLRGENGEIVGGVLEGILSTAPSDRQSTVNRTELDGLSPTLSSL